jgi:3',5'-cyclic AMP phosphodiesterase CpdA
MKIFHVSDTHGLHHQINIPNDIDVLAFTGDESNHRDPYRNEAEFYDFAEWFR